MAAPLGTLAATGRSSSNASSSTSSVVTSASSRMVKRHHQDLILDSKDQLHGGGNGGDDDDEDDEALLAPPSTAPSSLLSSPRAFEIGTSGHQRLSAGDIYGEDAGALLPPPSTSIVSSMPSAVSTGSAPAILPNLRLAPHRLSADSTGVARSASSSPSTVTGGAATSSSNASSASSARTLSAQQANVNGDQIAEHGSSWRALQQQQQQHHQQQQSPQRPLIQHRHSLIPPSVHGSQSTSSASSSANRMSTRPSNKRASTSAYTPSVIRPLVSPSSSPASSPLSSRQPSLQSNAYGLSSPPRSPIQPSPLRERYQLHSSERDAAIPTQALHLQAPQSVSMAALGRSLSADQAASLPVAEYGIPILLRSTPPQIPQPLPNTLRPTTRSDADDNVETIRHHSRAHSVGPGIITTGLPTSMLRRGQGAIYASPSELFASDDISQVSAGASSSNNHSSFMSPGSSGRHSLSRHHVRRGSGAPYQPFPPTPSLESAYPVTSPSSVGSHANQRHVYGPDHGIAVGKFAQPSAASRLQLQSPRSILLPSREGSGISSPGGENTPAHPSDQAFGDNRINFSMPSTSYKKTAGPPLSTSLNKALPQPPVSPIGHERYGSSAPQQYPHQMSGGDNPSGLSSPLEAMSTSHGTESVQSHGHQHETSVPWDVRETDKVLSTTDAKGRKMINQYCRLGDLGRGQHGHVWLCEDTSNGEYYAIKVVRRENRRNRNLKRSQAEAEAQRRQLDEAGDGFHDGWYENDGAPYHRQEYGESATALNSARQRTASNESEQAGVQSSSAAEPSSGRPSTDHNRTFEFDEMMQLNDPQPIVVKQPRPLSRKRTIIVDEKVKQEIAIMKRIHHPHVVRLREVIDDRKSKKIFMVLEYMPGGHIVWSKDDKPAMTVNESRAVFRDVVLGLEYLHHQGIIHRDIKPANLLWTQDRKTVKISDFGVSHLSEALARSSAADPNAGRVGPTDERVLRKTEGSPAFFAPELCSGVENTPIATPGASIPHGIDLERTNSRPEYFERKGSNRSSAATPGEHSYRLSALSALTPTDIHDPRHAASRPRSPAGLIGHTGRYLTISPPLTLEQQIARRALRDQRPLLGKGIDVWALGVTLYCLLFGVTPYHQATSEYDLYNLILKKEISIPATMGSDGMPTGSSIDRAVASADERYADGLDAVDLLSKLLDKDSFHRIKLHEVKEHPWVLRNLGDSQGWLEEHDLAETGVVRVTEEEVQHATAERTSSTVPEGGFKASVKRFGEIFGFSGKGLLRQSNRRDRSKSVSSTSASIATTSGWEGISEASRSRGASRQASMAKRRPSGRTISHPQDGDSTYADSFANHAAALKQKLINTKAAQAAQESHNSSPVIPQFTTGKGNALSRSVSGESRISDPQDSRRQSLAQQRTHAAHLLPPVTMQRRSSATPSEISSSAGMSLASSHKDQYPDSRTPGATVAQPDSENKFIEGFKNAWNKLKSSGSRGSASPAGTPQSKRPELQVGRSFQQANPSSAALQAAQQRQHVASLHARLREVEENPSHDMRHAPPHEHRPQVNIAASGLLPVAVVDSSSESSESHSDDQYEDELDFHHKANIPPLMWADTDTGWHTRGQLTPGLSQHGAQHLSDSSGRPSHDLDRPSTAENSRRALQAASNDLTPKATHKPSLREVAVVRSGRSSTAPSTDTSSGRPSFSRDGSLDKHSFKSRIPASPAGMSAHATAAAYVADDEDDDDDIEEEVVIKTRSRHRRGTDTSSGQPRPNLNAPRAAP